jgi:hypothetical protein
LILLASLTLVQGGRAAERGYFDRTLPVTVPGEISDKHEAVAEIFRALRPGGILSEPEGGSGMVRRSRI